MQWVMLAILTPCALILLGGSCQPLLPDALSSLGNAGPHGLSEILYAFSSAAGNNGSAFAGLNANTYFYNIVLANCHAARPVGDFSPQPGNCRKPCGKKDKLPLQLERLQQTPLFLAFYCSA